jgi:DNA polymerase-1
MKLSLQLLNVAPLRLTVPLWASVYRAPLASAHPLDFVLWLQGFSGTLKSTLAALFLSHYGAFDRTALPGEWITTANSLERRAFTLKDAVFVIDDYAPKADNRREMEAKAERLIRSQGNLSGRGRLRADLTERCSYPPRGLIVSTGEEIPPGLSGRARTLVVEAKKEDVSLALLSKAQQTADRLPHAMAGYIHWLAPQIPLLPALLRETFRGARDRANVVGTHLRVPELLAQLWIGIHCALTYAEEIGACSRSEAMERRHDCWAALLASGNDQARLIESERPSRRFLRVLLALVVQGQAVLMPKDDAKEVGMPQGCLLLGWVDDQYLYLIPDAAYQAVAHFCRDAGEPFSIAFERLKSDLRNEGLSEVEPDRRTKTAHIGGATRRVLQLRRASVEDLLGERFPSKSPESPVSPVLEGDGDGV